MKNIPLPRPPLYRFLEMLPALLDWGYILGLVALCFVAPIWAAIFIVGVNVYWLIRIIYLSVYLVLGYVKMQRNLKRDWLGEVKKFPGHEDIYHVVLFVIKNEYQVVDSTMEALARSHYDLKKVLVVISAEEKFYSQTKDALLRAMERHRNKFLDFMVTVHPFGIPGELVGKGSNETWGAKQAKKRLDELNIPLEKTIIEVFDIDTEIHPMYLPRVTHAFLTAPNPLRVSYQPVAMFINNAWDAPAIARVISCSSTFWQLMCQGRPERMETFTSHSMSFKTAVDVGYWTTDMVSEDSLIFYQCLLHYNGKYSVYPLHFPVSLDMVLADTLWQTMVNQYKQQRRWAWGVEGVPYVIYNLLKNKSISMAKKFEIGFFLWEGKFSWATTALTIGLLAWLPMLVGGINFDNTVFAQTLPVVTRTISSLAMIGLFISTVLTNIMIKRDPRKVAWYKRIGMWLQWLLLPITTIVFGSVVALDAHTRLMLGKYLGFFCTPKIRKRQKGGAFVNHG